MLPLIATAAQGAISYMQKSAVAAAQDAQHLQNAEEAGDASVVKSNALNENYQRNLEVLAGKEMDTNLATIKQEAAIANSASEGGVGGQSISQLLQIEQAAGLHQGTSIKRQADELRFNTVLESKGITAETQSRINSVQRGSRPSLFTELGMAGLSYASGKLLNPDTAGKTTLKKINITGANNDMDKLLQIKKGLF